ncbi:hypothetical protein A9K55_002450 [Cordyceps militaris]|uniref:Uncharacterized protein n=1 Tax=Cordyceps militaris TaxID=73501 RepID=A0A2H4S6R9_CORMI|nr:hypothetical protein A9K55_002450 [Cordyceps militaris]
MAMSRLDNSTTISQHLGGIERYWAHLTDSDKRHVFRLLYRLEPQLLESTVRELSDELRCEQSSPVYGSSRCSIRQPDRHEKAAVSSNRASPSPPPRHATALLCASSAQPQDKSPSLNQVSHTTSPTVQLSSITLPAAQLSDTAPLAEFSGTVPYAAQLPSTLPEATVSSGETKGKILKAFEEYFPSIPDKVLVELEAQSPTLYLMLDKEVLHTDIVQAISKTNNDAWKVSIRRKVQSIGFVEAFRQYNQKSYYRTSTRDVEQLAKLTGLEPKAFRLYLNAGERYQKLSLDLSLGILLLSNPWRTSVLERIPLAPQKREAVLSEYRKLAAHIDSSLLKRIEKVAHRLKAWSTQAWTSRFRGGQDPSRRKRKYDDNNNTNNSPAHKLRAINTTPNGPPSALNPVPVNQPRIASDKIFPYPSRAVSTVCGSPPTQPISSDLTFPFDGQINNSMPPTAVSTVCGSPPAQPISSDLTFPFDNNFSNSMPPTAVSTVYGSPSAQPISSDLTFPFDNNFSNSMPPTAVSTVYGSPPA